VYVNDSSLVLYKNAGKLISIQSSFGKLQLPVTKAELGGNLTEVDHITERLNIIYEHVNTIITPQTCYAAQQNHG